jgi:hypothetical protein
MTSDQLRPSEREPITGHPIVCPKCHQELSLFCGRLLRKRALRTL